ncbi:MAG: hypothetical protein ACHQQS_06645 [Thermoanaerobaculales bacterium]
MARQQPKTKAQLAAAIDSIQQRTLGPQHSRDFPRIIDGWRRLLDAAKHELGGTLDAAVAILTNNEGWATMAVPQVPAGNRPQLAMEILAVSDLMQVADRAFALATDLDALLDCYLTAEDNRLEALGEGDDDEEMEPASAPALTPDGWLTVTTVDGPNEVETLRSFTVS